MTNCRNCGAPIDSLLYKCPYCGTVYSHIHESKLSGNYRNVKSIIVGRNSTGEVYQLQMDYDWLKTLINASSITKSLYSEAIKAMRRYGEVRVL